MAYVQFVALNVLGLPFLFKIISTLPKFTYERSFEIYLNKQLHKKRKMEKKKKKLGCSLGCSAQTPNERLPCVNFFEKDFGFFPSPSTLTIQSSIIQVSKIFHTLIYYTSKVLSIKVFVLFSKFKFLT